MGAAQSEVPVPRTYGNWRRPSTPGLFGLGSAGTGMLFAGLVHDVRGIAEGGEAQQRDVGGRVDQAWLTLDQRSSKLRTTFGLVARAWQLRT